MSVTSGKKGGRVQESAKPDNASATATVDEAAKVATDINTETVADDVTKAEAVETPAATETTPKVDIPEAPAAETVGEAVQQGFSMPVQLSPAVMNVINQLSDTPRSYLTAIANYMANMAQGKSVTEAQIHAHQRGLYRDITSLINTLEVEFDHTFAALLGMIKEDPTGCFHDAYIYRELPNIAMSSTDFHGFQRILDLLRHTADIKVREAVLKHTDLNKALEYGISERGRQKVASFYTSL